MFGNNANYRVELIQTMDEETFSPVKEILKKNGPTPYHICYKTNDIKQEIDQLQSEKWLLLLPPQKAIGFGENIKVAFLMKRSVGIIELVESEG